MIYAMLRVTRYGDAMIRDIAPVCYDNEILTRATSHSPPLSRRQYTPCDVTPRYVLPPGIVARST